MGFWARELVSALSELHDKRDEDESPGGIPLSSVFDLSPRKTDVEWAEVRFRPQRCRHGEEGFSMWSCLRSWVRTRVSSGSISRVLQVADEYRTCSFADRYTCFNRNKTVVWLIELGLFRRRSYCRFILLPSETAVSPEILHRTFK